MRDIFSLNRNALITAFVAGDLFIVLPVLIESSRTLVERAGVGQAQAQLPDVIVPASFNFPHTGKLLSISFILFAGWFADAAVPLTEYPRLALTGLVTFFGSVNVAVPFLLDLFRIPADTFQLFLASGVINSRFGTLVAAMHTLAVALLGTCAMTGALRWDRRRMVRYLTITTILTVGVFGGTRIFFGRALRHEYSKDKVLAGMHLLHQPVQAVVHKAPFTPSTPPEPGPRLDIIRRRGVLTVGYLPDSLPYAFFNAAGDLVGLDVELAHRLRLGAQRPARVRPARPRALGGPGQRRRVRHRHVRRGRHDAAGEPDAVLDVLSRRDDGVCRARRAAERVFVLGSAACSGRGLRLAIPNVPYYIQKIHERLPQAELQVVDELTPFFAGAGDSGPTRSSSPPSVARPGR